MKRCHLQSLYKAHLHMVATWLCNTSKGNVFKSSGSWKWLSAPYLHGLRGRNGHSENLESHMESCSHASGAVSNFTLYFKVSMHVPMTSSSNYIYFPAFLQTSISGVQGEHVQLPRAMQVAQDAPQLPPNPSAIRVEDMMDMRKV